MAGDRYDIFISYAREDLEWVQEHLHEPLQRCRMKDGRALRIFFDIGEQGIAIGENFLSAITTAIEKARHIIPVYSPHYFRKRMCRFELNLALQCHVMSDEGKLFPILKEPECAGQVPFAVRAINYWSVSDSAWFSRLCAALEVSTVAAQPQLNFFIQPTTSTARLTLAPVKVEVQVSGTRRTVADDEITIAAEGADLQGTLKQPAVSGVATFSDLVVPTAASHVTLVASAGGMAPVRSAGFNVLAPPPPPPDPNPPTINTEGEAIFFANGRAILLVRPESVAVYSVTGQLLAPEVALVGRIRLVARSNDLIAIADWSGNLWLFSDTGQCRSWAFGGGKGGFVVPGGIAFDGQNVYVGFWSGLVFQVSLAGNVAESLKHEGGVQSLVIANGRCYIADFSGTLAVYDLASKRLVNSRMVEKAIWTLRAAPDHILAIGDQYSYQITLSPFEIHRETLPTGATSGVYGDTARPVLVSADGVGLRVNPQLIYKPRFRVAPGAVPIGADERGTFCVCVTPDGRRTLVREGKAVYSHAVGTLSVSPLGDRLAVGEPGGVRVVAASSFAPLVQGGGM